MKNRSKFSICIILLMVFANQSMLGDQKKRPNEPSFFVQTVYSYWQRSKCIVWSFQTAAVTCMAHRVFSAKWPNYYQFPAAPLWFQTWRFKGGRS